MGGSGSGRWYRWDTKTTIEEVRRLDIRYMRQHGLLRPGYLGSMTWHRGDKETGSIQFHVSYDNRIVLDYRYREYSGEWESVRETIMMDWTPCHYGGTRPWFRCPGCARRVGVLCGYGKWFLCRHCHRLPYASQQQSHHDRMMDQAWKIRKRLEVGESLFEPLGPWHKPKRMHWRTFAKLTAREKRYSRASLSAFKALIDKEKSARK